MTKEKRIELFKEEFKQTIIDFFLLWEKKTGLRLNKLPEIKTDLVGMTSGRCSYSKNLIRYNAALIAENWPESKQTVGHEIAHWLTRHYHPWKISPHGKEWKKVMRILELEVRRGHSYDVTNHVVRKHKKVPYFCNTCKEEIPVGIRRHNRAVREKVGLVHIKCKTEIRPR